MSDSFSLHTFSNHDIRYQGISILVVDNEPGMRTLLKKALGKLFGNIDTAESIEQAEVLRLQKHYDLVILDINLPGRSGIEWEEVFEESEYRPDVIFITGYADLQTTIQALKLGASDFILKPFNLEHMFISVRKCIDKRLENRVNLALRRDVQRFVSAKIVGSSDKTKHLTQQISQFAPSKATVLIQGESGTGKELVARGLHEKSGRSGPFVPINCGSMTESELARELFGVNSTAPELAPTEGLFQIANGGTLYLDEVIELPEQIQTALLRVLEERRVRPIGSDKAIQIDVRVIVSTNKKIKQLVDEGKFRKDLYYRLNVLEIFVPPLRERTTDLIDLIPFFAQQLSNEQGINTPDWLAEDVSAMHYYDWPGNVRELKNLIERCILLGKSPAQYWRESNMENKVLHNNHAAVTMSHEGVSSSFPVFSEESPIGYPDNWTLRDVERAHIQQVVKYCDYNKSSAAKQLGVARKTIDRKYKEWESQGE